MGFGIDATGEFAGNLDSPGISGGIRVAHRPALLVAAGLSENATELDVATMRAAIFSLPAASLCFLGHHGNAGGIHLHIHHGSGLPHGHGQFQLHGLLDGQLLAVRDVCANIFRHPLDSLGGDFQFGQQFHLLAVLIEQEALATDQGQHATHAG